MKKSLIYSLLLGFLLITTASFVLIKNKPVKKAVAKKVNTIETPKSCIADVTFGSVHVTAISSSSATIEWSYTGSPTSFAYGGYYNITVFPSSINIIPGSVTAPTHQVTIPLPAHLRSFRFGAAPVCSDGSFAGPSHGALFSYDGTIELQF